MRTADLPPSFAPLTTKVENVHRVGREWRSSCPYCGGGQGSDRFVMWEESRATGGPMGRCRQCQRTWRPDDEKAWKPLTDEEIAEIAERRRQRAEEEQAEIARNRALFRQQPIWADFHHNLEHYPRAVDLWFERYGLTEWALEYYQLGYCPDFKYFHDGEEQHTDTLTVPIFKPATRYHAVNLKHRLLDPEAKGGKYRPHTAGLGQTLFFANLNRIPSSLPFVLIVEGAIKAAVIWQAVMLPMMRNAADEKTQWFCENVQVIGIPGTSLNDVNLPAFEPAGRVYIAFDPDANERHDRKPSKAEILARQLGANRSKIVSLPGKPDDLVIAGTLRIRDLVMLMRDGRRA